MEDIKPIDKFTLDKYVKEEDDLLEYVKQSCYGIFAQMYMKAHIF